MRARRKTTDETKLKISRALLGHPVKKLTRLKISLAGRNRVCSLETRKKISNALKGRPSPTKGLPVSKATRIKLSLAHKGRPPTVGSFKKGHIGYWKGKHRSEKLKKRLSKIAKLKNLVGPRCPAWKGGKFSDDKGYIRVNSPNHPYRDKTHGYVMEHRLVMEKHLKRYLLPKEVVHHINGNKQDNRIENLKLFSSDNKHKKFHMHNGDRNGQFVKVKGRLYQ